MFLEGYMCRPNFWHNFQLSSSNIRLHTKPGKSVSNETYRCVGTEVRQVMNSKKIYPYIWTRVQMDVIIWCRNGWSRPFLPVCIADNLQFTRKSNDPFQEVVVEIVHYFTFLQKMVWKSIEGSNKVLSSLDMVSAETLVTFLAPWMSDINWNI